MFQEDGELVCTLANPFGAATVCSCFSNSNSKATLPSLQGRYTIIVVKTLQGGTCGLCHAVEKELKNSLSVLCSTTQLCCLSFSLSCTENGRKYGVKTSDPDSS